MSQGTNVLWGTNVLDSIAIIIIISIITSEMGQRFLPNTVWAKTPPFNNSFPTQIDADDYDDFDHRTAFQTYVDPSRNIAVGDDSNDLSKQGKKSGELRPGELSFESLCGSQWQQSFELDPRDI